MLTIISNQFTEKLNTKLLKIFRSPKLNIFFVFKEGNNRLYIDYILKISSKLKLCTSYYCFYRDIVMNDRWLEDLVYKFRSFHQVIIANKKKILNDYKVFLYRLRRENKKQTIKIRVREIYDNLDYFEKFISSLNIKEISKININMIEFNHFFNRNPILFYKLVQHLGVIHDYEDASCGNISFYDKRVGFNSSLDNEFDDSFQLYTFLQYLKYINIYDEILLKLMENKLKEI